MHIGSEPVIPDYTLGTVLSVVRERSADPQKLLALAGAPTLDPNPGPVPLPPHTIRRIHDVAAEIVGDPNFGLRLAQRLGRGTYGMLDFLCYSAPTLRDCSLAAARYISLIELPNSSPTQVTFEERSDEATWTWYFPGFESALGRHAAEAMLARMVVMLRRVIIADKPVVAREVWFSHSAPADVRELEAVFGTTRIRFGAETNGIVVDRRLLDATFTTSDAELFSYLRSCADDVLKTRATTPTGSVLDRLNVYLSRNLSDATLGADSAARSLAMSKRSLQRALMNADTSFREQLDSLRRDRALALVRDGRRTLKEVANLVGFSSTPNFLRAFRRWTGTSPKRYRQSLTH